MCFACICLCVPGSHRRQKWASDPLEPKLQMVGCEPLCGYLELDPVLLQKQPVSHLSSLKLKFVLPFHLVGYSSKFVFSFPLTKITTPGKRKQIQQTHTKKGHLTECTTHMHASMHACTHKRTDMQRTSSETQSTNLTTVNSKEF